MLSLYRAVFGVPTSVVYPILTFLLLIIVLAYWGVVAVYPTYMYCTCIIIIVNNLGGSFCYLIYIILPEEDQTPSESLTNSFHHINRLTYM